MLRRSGKSPEWVQELLKEFTKPPYFLQIAWQGAQMTHNSSQQKQPGEAPHAHIPTMTVEKPGPSTGQQTHASSPNLRQESMVNRTPQQGEDDAAIHTKPGGRRMENANTLGSPVSNTNSSQPSTGVLAKETGLGAGVTNVASVHQNSSLATNRAGLDPTSNQTATPMGATRSWQAVLRMNGIPPTLPAAYGWSVSKAMDLGGAVRVMTQKGSYVLKKTHLSAARVEFLHQLLTYVENQGFTRFAPFQPTKRNKSSLSRNNQVFYATRWIPGRPLNLAFSREVRLTAQTLAEFHELSCGFEAQGYNPPSEFDLLGMLRRRSQDLHTLLLRAEATAQPDEFDDLLRYLAVSLREDTDRSVRLGDAEECRSFLTADEEKCGVCHLDVIPENFIFRDETHVYALDFDLATFAPRVLDVSHLLRRSLQRQNWNESVAYVGFSQYNEIRSFTTPEYIWVQALLTFPYRAWRAAHTRYRMWKDPSQLDELREFARESDRRKSFLQALAGQIRH